MILPTKHCLTPFHNTSFSKSLSHPTKQETHLTKQDIHPTKQDTYPTKQVTHSTKQGRSSIFLFPLPPFYIKKASLPSLWLDLDTSHHHTFDIFKFVFVICSNKEDRFKQLNNIKSKADDYTLLAHPLCTMMKSMITEHEPMLFRLE